MIGVVVVGHGRLGEEFVRTVESIMGRQPKLVAVATHEGDSREIIRSRIQAAVSQVDAGEGVLICTDMLGDTATNQSLAVARDTGAEVLAGVNMPILLKCCTDRTKSDLPTLVRLLDRYGGDHIVWATEPQVRRSAAR